MMINFHSMEYYFQWYLGQYCDSLGAGPCVVCFLAEARDFLAIQNIRPALGTSGLLFSGCCGLFPSVEQLMHQAVNAPLLSAEVADECSCKCAVCVCLHAVQRDNFTFCHCLED